MEWKKDKQHKPCLVYGIRQSGKTESILNFAKENYRNFIYINFWNERDYVSMFDSSLEVDDLVSLISLRFPDVDIHPGKTVFLFDEIQECPRARLSLKNFSLDGRYDVIASGSFLGINGYHLGDSTPAPVGYEHHLTMKLMDFEEFLWANGYTEEKLSVLEDHFRNHTPVEPSLHLLFTKLFRIYLCIGGYPEAVSSYIRTKELSKSMDIVKDNITGMENEFGRRIDASGNPVFKAGEVARIHSAFSLIPSFLSKESKRFVVSRIEGGKAEEKRDATEYLRQCGIVCKVHNLQLPSFPYEANRIPNQFKMFTSDIGILVSLLGKDAAYSILTDDMDQNKGAIYEEAVFDSLYKSDMDVYYYAKESGLEVDFVLSFCNENYLVEVKARNGNCKSSKTILNHPEKYGKAKLMKIGNYNVGMENDILTLPHYMTYLLGKIDKETRKRQLASLMDTNHQK